MIATTPHAYTAWNGGDDRTDQHLCQTARRGGDHRTEHQTDVHVLRKQKRRRAEQQQTGRADQRHTLDGGGDIEFMGKERKHQVDRQLRGKIDQHQKPEQRVGNAVQRPQGQEQERGQIADDRHGDVAGVARPFQASVGSHKSTSKSKSKRGKTMFA